MYRSYYGDRWKLVCVCVCVCVCVRGAQSSWLCVCGLLPLCDEVQMRAVVPYARHQRTEELPDASVEDGKMCGSRPWEALNLPLKLVS